ncbi:hypothetical protein ACPCG0_10420 [Propionibacteriaceae bacterium Y1923]|uniref:arsenate reductase/protein-tyrosine-phosphatase family protein n=1 Tax=Aestuariimicrobium sp. Y1814 TaxID=3418742 RepID=UPI003C1F3757
MKANPTRDCAWVLDESTGTVYAMRLPGGHPIALEGSAALIFTDLAEGLDPVAEAVARWPEEGDEVARSTRAFVDDLVNGGLVELVDDPAGGPDDLDEPGTPARRATRGLPGPDPAQPEPEPFRVLFVCTANVCRSAYADVVATAAGVPGLAFSSAGTHGWADELIDPPMAAELPAGVDASAHRGKQVTRAMLEQADLVIAMAARHRDFIQEEWPALARKSFVMGHVARELATLPDGATREQVAQHLWQRRTQHPEDSVADPYRRGQEAARACATRIDADLGVILERLATVRLGGPDE